MWKRQLRCLGARNGKELARKDNFDGRCQSVLLPVAFYAGLAFLTEGWLPTLNCKEGRGSCWSWSACAQAAWKSAYPGSLIYHWLCLR